MLPFTKPRRVMLAFTVCVAIALACAGDSTPPIASPLAGLQRVGADDTTSGPPPEQPAPTPGSFRGTVKGYEPGPDTLASAIPLPDVRVTAYPRVESGTDTLGVGPAAGSILTNASGEFQLPTLPGGEYIVTFNPPTGSKYGGVWAIATAHSGSNDRPWFIMLATK